MPTCSRRYSLVSAASPPATDADCDVPDKDIYSGSPLPWVPLPQAKPLGFLASSALPEQISIPGATTSGLILPSIVEPSLEIASTAP